MHFADTRAISGQGPPLQGVDNGQELTVAECGGAAELSPGACLHHGGQPSYVIVVPVRGDDKPNGLGRIYADALQVLERPRAPGRIDARIDDDPGTLADMQDDTLTP